VNGLAYRALDAVLRRKGAEVTKDNHPGTIYSFRQFDGTRFATSDLETAVQHAADREIGVYLLQKVIKGRMVPEVEVVSEEPGT